jgi:hypothetical protein
MALERNKERKKERKKKRKGGNYLQCSSNANKTRLRPSPIGASLASQEPPLVAPDWLD